MNARSFLCCSILGFCAYLNDWNIGVCFSLGVAVGLSEVIRQIHCEKDKQK